MAIERAEYSPIIDRPPFKLPGGARVAVWVIVNVEMWDIESPLPRTAAPPPGGGTVVPDIPNYSWYDYGLRVGVWRIKSILDRHAGTADWPAVQAKVSRKAILVLSGDQDDTYAAYIHPKWPDIRSMAVGQGGVGLAYGAYVFASAENARCSPVVAAASTPTTRPAETSGTQAPLFAPIRSLIRSSMACQRATSASSSPAR